MVKCCRCLLENNGIYFSDYVEDWDEICRMAHETRQVRVLDGWRPWHFIYEVWLPGVMGPRTYAVSRLGTMETRETMRERYKLLRERGRCVKCGLKSKPGTCMCVPCARRNSELRRARAALRRHHEDQTIN